MSKQTVKYAINKDLSIEVMYSFSSPQGDEFAFGVDYDQLMAIHPHAIALKSALARRGSTEYEYRVGCARAFGPKIRICLTCRNPNDEIGYSQEQFAIIEEAGLALYEGWIDETGDHALVNGRHADRAGVLCGVVEMIAQHTPGRVTFRDDGDADHWSLLTADGRWLLALLHNGEAPSERQAANFRRLAACWNACEGVRTEALEHRSHLLKAVDDQIAMLTTQRDELLEALKKTAEHIEAMRAHIKPLRFKQHCWQQALNARAAIAKVEGGAA